MTTDSTTDVIGVASHALFDNSGLLAIARLKKPHRHFLAGDLVVGEQRDGMADNLVCWGWSSKHRRIVGGKWGYRMRYCAWEWLPRRFHRAAENAKFEDAQKYRMIAPNGTGYLRIVKWFKGWTLNDEQPRQLRDEAWTPTGGPPTATPGSPSIAGNTGATWRLGSWPIR